MSDGPVTRTELANLALAALGETKRLLDLEGDTTAVGRSARDAFWQAWDETLRGYPWNCAKKRVRLAAMELAPAFGYSIQYQLPADFIGVQEIDGLGPGGLYSIEVVGEPGSEVLVLASDLPAPLDLTYTYKLRNIGLADAAFKGAFKYLLAFEIAPAVTKDTKKRDSCWAVWDSKVNVASRADARDGPRRRPPESEIVSCRE